MPRTARASVGGYCYHVLNRGNARARVFHDESDYKQFVEQLHEAASRVPMRVIAYCLMPNHFHLVLCPIEDGDLSKWMQWLQSAYVQNYRLRYKSSGHISQGRFKAFPIEGDDHLLTVVRYVERNPLRAGLVVRAEEWPWSSLAEWVSEPSSPWLDTDLFVRGPDWLERVNEPQTEAELAALQSSVTHGIPFGSSDWVERTATRLGLQSVVRPGGRPRKLK